MPTKGNIRTGDWVAKIELTLDTAIYASGDLMAQPVEIEYAVMENGCSVIQSVTVIDYDDQGANFDLVFFGENPGSLGALNATLAITDGTAEKVLGSVTMDTYKDVGAQQLGIETSCGLVIRPEDGGTSVWVAAISRGTGTYASGRMAARIGLLRG
jgi:hypothetical protein